MTTVLHTTTTHLINLVSPTAPAFEGALLEEPLNSDCI
jgi:hypothetical protein